MFAKSAERSAERLAKARERQSSMHAKAWERGMEKFKKEQEESENANKKSVEEVAEIQKDMNISLRGSNWNVHSKNKVLCSFPVLDIFDIEDINGEEREKMFWEPSEDEVLDDSDNLYM